MQPFVTAGPCSLPRTRLLLVLVMLLLPKSNALMAPSPVSFKLIKKLTIPAKLPYSLFDRTSPLSYRFILNHYYLETFLPAHPQRGSHCVDQGSLKLTEIYLPQFSPWWDGNIQLSSQLQCCFSLSSFEMFHIWLSSFKWNYLSLNHSLKLSPNKTIFSILNISLIFRSFRLPANYSNLGYIMSCKPAWTIMWDFHLKIKLYQAKHM